MQRFFKTAPGEYAEGDRFLGITVPQLRACCKAYPRLTLPQIDTLLRSPFHEERLFALLSLVAAFKRGSRKERARICAFYLARARWVNNWDLVDLSAGYILGAYLRLYVPRQAAQRRLAGLARSRHLWTRRIAMVATLDYIRSNELRPVFATARILLADEHDLMHKATGWMLREAGKRDRPALERFLKRHCRRMPRTMLRYALERFPVSLRRKYLAGRV